ncbi:unnamed protein product [Lymnaea stagnalis]|uniref:Uncharacterized protein n=1 Tax=Lymnaea stagnalis TaxID=6523 RepID=A0AAV2HNR0_LYMST
MPTFSLKCGVSGLKIAMNTEFVLSAFTILCCTEIILCENLNSAANDDISGKTTLIVAIALSTALSISLLLMCAWCLQNKNSGDANINSARIGHVQREYVDNEHRYVEIIDGNGDSNVNEELHTYETVGRTSTATNNGNSADKRNTTSKNNEYETIENVMI